MKERGIRFKLYQSVLAKAIRNNHREVCFPSFGSMSKVCLLICEPNLVFYKPEIDRISKLSSVELVLFTEKKRLKGDHSKMIFSNDLNWMGIPKAKWVHDWLRIPFDLLINLNHETLSALDFLSAASVSKFKTGAIAQNRVYDLVIQLPEHQKHGLIDAVLETMERLKSNH